MLRAFINIDCSFEKLFPYLLKPKELNNGLKESIINGFLNSSKSIFFKLLLLTFGIGLVAWFKQLIYLFKPNRKSSWVLVSKLKLAINLYVADICIDL